MRFESQSSTEHCIDDVHSNTSMLFCLSVCMKKNTYRYTYIFIDIVHRTSVLPMLVSHVHKPEMKNTGVAWVIHMLVLTLQVTSTPPRDRTSERDVSRACMEHAQHGEVTYKRRRRHTRLANAPQQLLRAVVVAAAACCFAPPAAHRAASR